MAGLGLPWTRAAWLVPLAALACAPAPRPAAPQARPLPVEAKAATPIAARHLLDRFAFGPRPGEVDAVIQEGTRAWFEHQLRADELPDPRADRAVLPYRRALAPPEHLPDLYGVAGLPPEAPAMGTRRSQSRALMRQTSTRQLLLELQMAEIVRHVASEYQLREVMVDFWINHFNIYAKKEEVRLLAGDYVERVIRPAALGSFEDLLVLTAQHPAMLRYLDNASSRATPKAGGANVPGISENYARELLELHTLGVDGGYDQADVVATARILTGWTFRPGPDGRGYAYRFHQGIHDRGAKVALGFDFPAGGGQEEGLRLLHILATHPATARHLGHKLCVRFVADEPPAECIEATTNAFIASAGSIKETLRALFDSRSFWTEEYRRHKLKTPLEFLVSAVRGLDARLSGTTELARTAERLGEAPFTQPSPAGRSEDAAHWLDSFTLARLGFARDVAFGRVAGVVFDWHAAPTGETDPRVVTASLCATLLGGQASQKTLHAIEQALTDVPDDERIASGAALALSSPEFQWR